MSIIVYCLSFSSKYAIIRSTKGGVFMTDLPKRRIKLSSDNDLIKKDYSYRNILNQNIQDYQINAVIISIEDLSCDMTKFIQLIEKNPTIQLKFMDYDSVVFIDKILKRTIENKAFLMDDSTRKDRGYIDLTKLKHIHLTIPLNYLMWGVRFNQSIDTYCFLMYNHTADYWNPTSLNGNESLSYKDYRIIMQKIEELTKFHPTSSKEKVALVSDFIQSCVQYIDGYESTTSKGTFITPDFPECDKYLKKSGLVETVIKEHNGVCMGIANLSTLLLNNSQMDVEVESVYGCSHAWNKVLIDGKHYYFDNTWSITRNEDLCEDGLVALSFTKKYLLFGEKTSNSIGHHNRASRLIYDGVASEEDIDQLDYESQFTYQKKPIYKSFKK